MTVCPKCYKAFLDIVDDKCPKCKRGVLDATANVIYIIFI